MDSKVVNGVTYWLPADNNEVITLVNDAKKNNQIICVRGAAHSFPLIGDLEVQKVSASGKSYQFVMLSNMYKITITGDTVVVPAGCHLGKDPWDPTGISTDANSLLVQLDQQGLALPDLGGITHQTIGGFLSTGSSGGSVKYSFEDALLSVDIVTCENGVATQKTFTKPADGNLDDPFYGAGVATMGLLGVIVSATFKCEQKYYITGQEDITTEADCAINLFPNETNAANGKPGFEQFLRDTEYTRMFWWPQKNVAKTVVWQAKRATEQEANAWAKNAYDKINAYRRAKGEKEIPVQPLKLYQEVPWVAGSPTLMTLGADLLYTAIGQWPNWLYDVMGDTAEYNAIKMGIDLTFYDIIFPKLLDVFVKPDSTDNENGGPQLFSDIGYNGIPMDNQMSDKLFPVWFTELWIDISQTQNVMNELQAFYHVGAENAGYFNCEIYATKQNGFWLSPAYNRDVVRFDILWFANSSGNPVTFYQKFWELLAKYSYRPHWAKYLPDETMTAVVPDPDNPGKTITITLGASYLKSNYPKWENWMALRQQLDPDQIFVNDYWRKHLGIPAV